MIKMIIAALIGLLELLIAAAWGSSMIFPEISDSMAEQGMMACTLEFLAAVFVAVLAIVTIFRIHRKKSLALALLLYAAVAGQVVPVLIRLMFEEGLPDALIYGVMTLIVLSPIPVILYWKKIAESTRKATQSKMKKTEGLFEIDKVKWYYDGIDLDYRQKMGIEGEVTLSDDEIEKLWEYSCNPIAYVFAWLLKRDRINTDGFVNEYSNTEEILETLARIKKEDESPVSFLLNDMDGVFVGTELIEEEKIRAFLYEYYETGWLQDRDGEYFSYDVDYQTTVGSYCKEFSWDAYHRLEALLDERFYLYMMSYEYMFEAEHGAVAWDEMKASIVVRSDSCVPKAYVEFCKTFFEQNQKEIAEAMIKAVIEESPEEIDEAYVRSEMVQIGEMGIPNPKCFDVPAFVLAGEWDVDPEHGLMVGFRGMKVCGVGGYMDVDVWENE